MKTCFVISPIGTDNSDTRLHSNEVFEKLLLPVMKDLNIKALRADKINKAGRISDQMFTEIFTSDMCVAILTKHNPNVFYELAIAQSINKPVIILIADGEELPFDIQDLRCIYYDLKPGSLEKHKNTLREFVRSFEENNWKTDDIFKSYRHLTEFYVDPDQLAAQKNIHRFCERAKGYWWSKGTDPGSVGFVEFTHDNIIGTLEINGRTYTGDGQLMSDWKSIASCINLKNRTLYYYWEGKWTKNPNDKNQGFGEYTFFDAEGDFVSGNGQFFDRVFGDIRSSTMKRSSLERCTKQEVATMQKGKSQAIATLVSKNL